MANYTPAIYRQLGGPTVAIDLSSLADIGDVKDSVAAISASTTRIETGNTSGNSSVINLITDAQEALEKKIDATDDAIAALAESTQRIERGTTDVSAAVAANEEKAVARHQALLDAIAGIEVEDDEHPELDEDDLPVLRLVLKAQTSALSGRRDTDAENKIAQKLADQEELLTGFKECIDVDVASEPGRSEYFWALHDFIEDVTAD
jgi:hypothetical protein